ncbi:MAG TPA: LysM peptidoglycan-binding domain-containing protein [Candidatus Saccharimonadales bacterium]
MRRLKILAAVLAITVSLISPVVSAQSVAAAGNIGGRPALPRKDEPRSQSIFIHTLKQGETANDKVLISNGSDKTETALLYAVDAIPSNTGAFTCKQKAEAVTEAGAWISLAKQEVTLKPGDSDIVNFSIKAPKNGDVGEHNACIAIETKGDEGEVNGNLRIRTRSAIRVALTIPGELHRKVAISSYSVSIDNYKQMFNVALSNEGNVSSDTDVKVSLRSAFGEVVYQNSGQYPILPGNKLELTFENDKSPFFGGWYTADASISYDKNASKWGTQSTGSIEEVKAKSQVVFIMPQPLALLIFAVAILVVGWLATYLIVRHRRTQYILATWRRYRVKDGDTLEYLAEATGAKWKQIAKVNDIKAPYVLKAGSIIRLPKPAAKKNVVKG